MFLQLISYMRRRQIEAGYVEVNSPDMMEKSLWETSGHWEKFGDHMFTTKHQTIKLFCCKPMNCPGHVQIFKHGLKSYRDLPLKIAEFGKVHRYEPSGCAAWFDAGALISPRMMLMFFVRQSKLRRNASRSMI